MKLSAVLTWNAIIWIAAGIAFAMYGPLMMSLFDIPELNIDPLTYWYIAAFARLFGAALFSAGLLMFALRRTADQMDERTRRGVVMALLIGSLVCLISSLVQQSSFWGTPAGWTTSAVFLVFTLLYGAIYIRDRQA